MPAQAGIQRRSSPQNHWIPAFAGMTSVVGGSTNSWDGFGIT
jgi:hypothetical protein